MTVAFGTSMPTSTTVVETRTCTVAGGERPHHALLLVLAQPAVQQRDAELGKHLGREVVGHLRRGPHVDLRRLLDQRVDDVRLAPGVQLRAARSAYTSSRRDWGMTCVSAGVRPGGSSRITETSRSPYTVSASVRGMGVAVITSTSGLQPLRRSTARCITPKRCCSSTTTSPRRANVTASCTSACVPTTSVRAADARLGQHATAPLRRRRPGQQRHLVRAPPPSSRRMVR